MVVFCKPHPHLKPKVLKIKTDTPNHKLKDSLSAIYCLLQYFSEPFCLESANTSDFHYTVHSGPALGKMPDGPKKLSPWRKISTLLGTFLIDFPHAMIYLIVLYLFEPSSANAQSANPLEGPIASQQATTLIFMAIASPEHRPARW